MRCQHHVTPSIGQESKAHGTALLVVTRDGLDRTIGDHQMEPGDVPGTPTTACAMGMVPGSGLLGTVSDCQGERSFQVVGCGMPTRTIVWCSGCATIPSQAQTQGQGQDAVNTVYCTYTTWETGLFVDARGQG